jgi:hypothetical protein
MKRNCIILAIVIALILAIAGLAYVAGGEPTFSHASVVSRK